MATFPSPYAEFHNISPPLPLAIIPLPPSLITPHLHSDLLSASAVVLSSLPYSPYCSSDPSPSRPLPPIRPCHRLHKEIAVRWRSAPSPPLEAAPLPSGGSNDGASLFLILQCVIVSELMTRCNSKWIIVVPAWLNLSDPFGCFGKGCSFLVAWFRVPQDVVATGGKCHLLKWVTGMVLFFTSFAFSMFGMISISSNGGFRYFSARDSLLWCGSC